MPKVVVEKSVYENRILPEREANVQKLEKVVEEARIKYEREKQSISPELKEKINENSRKVSEAQENFAEEFFDVDSEELQPVTKTIEKVSRTSDPAEIANITEEAVNNNPKEFTTVIGNVGNVILDTGKVIFDSLSSRSKTEINKLSKTLEKGASNLINKADVVTLTEIGNAAVSAVATGGTPSSMIARCIQTLASNGFSRYKAILYISLTITLATILGTLGLSIYNTVQQAKLATAVIANFNNRTQGCFMFTSSSTPIKLDGCSDWYNEGDNKFLCKCGPLVNSLQTSNCDKDDDCTLPYCLGKQCSKKVDGEPLACSRNDKTTLPLYQCTSVNRDDPNFINYQYSDVMPLGWVPNIYQTNKVIYEEGKNKKSNLWLYIGIAVFVFVIIAFGMYYFRNKKIKKILK